MRIIKIVSVILYLLIPIDSVHFGAPLGFFLLVGLLSGEFLATLLAAGVCLAMAVLMWTVMKPRIRRDKFLIPVIAILLLLNLSLYIEDIASFTNLLHRNDFLIPFALFVLLTIVYTVWTLTKKEKAIL